MEQPQEQYPIQFSVDYPDRSVSRFSSFFRPIAVIPIAIVLGLVGEILIIPPLLLILFRNKYPRWWFDWSVELMRFESRVTAYALLLRDEYPSTDEEQSVHLEVPYPDVPQDLNRWLPLVKWILAIPHYIVVSLMSGGDRGPGLATWLAVFGAVGLLFNGRYPSDIFTLVMGLNRWSIRVWAYATLMTDEYQPFRLEE